MPSIILFLMERAGSIIRPVLVTSATSMSLILTSCQLLKTTTASQSATEPDFISQDWPIDGPIGKRDHPKILKLFGDIYHNPEIEQVLSDILGRLISASPNPDRGFRLTILDTPLVNAFALPGGYLYISRGFLALANDESEIAAVLAHEMAHVTARHAIARLSRTEAAGTARGIVDLVENNPERAELSLLASQKDYARFTRVQELEADNIGINLMFKAGYSPHAAPRLLRSLRAHANFESKQLAKLVRRDFLATHPTTPERLKKARNTARRFGPLPTSQKGRDEYLAGLNGMIYGPSPEQGYVRGNRFFHPKLKFRFSVPKTYTLGNRASSLIASNADGKIIRFDAVEIPRGLSLSHYLSSGWVNNLDRASVKSTRINGHQAATAKANVSGKVFLIGLVRQKKSTYRIIIVSNKDSTALQKDFAYTLNSFRALSSRESRALQPARINIISVQEGDTIERLAAKMQAVEHPVRLFKILNDIELNNDLKPGQLVKIISD